MKIYASEQNLAGIEDNSIKVVSHILREVAGTKDLAGVAKDYYAKAFKQQEPIIDEDLFMFSGALVATTINVNCIGKIAEIINVDPVFERKNFTVLLI